MSYPRSLGNNSKLLKQFCVNLLPKGVETALIFVISLAKVQKSNQEDMQIMQIMWEKKTWSTIFSCPCKAMWLYIYQNAAVLETDGSFLILIN